MKNNNFYKTLLNIAGPITLQHLITSSLNLIDTLMIGGLGEASIAAVGISNRLFFFFMVSTFGIYSACGIFASQFWGKRDLVNLHRVMGVMLTLSLPFAMLFVGVAMLFPGQFIALFRNDPEVVALGVDYLRIVAPSFILTSLSFMFAYTSRSIHLTKYPMYISVLALSTNTVLNYILIYGHFGAPRLGVRGAAIATAAARGLELALFVLVIYVLVRHPLRTGLREMFSYNRSMISAIVKRGVPVFINEATWSLGNTVYFIAYGMLGTSSLAVVQIAQTVADALTSVFIGLSSACSVMIGNALGIRDFERAKGDAKRFTQITIVLALIVMVIIVGLSFVMPQFYGNLSEQTRQLLATTIVVAGLFQVPKMYNFTAVVGILRSGGDTVFCMLLDLVGVWGIGIPMAFVAAIFFDVPIYVVVAAAYFEEVAKSIPAYIRIRQGKWLNNIVDDLSSS